MATTNYDFDILYLGSGHGTFDGAPTLAKQGLKVGVIEAGLVGGTCPNYGCNAKITLDFPVHLQHQVHELNPVLRGALTLDWNANLRHKQKIIEPLPDMLTHRMTDSGMMLIKGFGHFVDAHTIAVNETQYTADKIVIATGLKPRPLTIPGNEWAMDSTAFMALDNLPANLVIIGGGYIAMEFATMAIAAGSQVTVILRGDHALRQFHQPLVNQLMLHLTDQGVTFLRQTTVQAIKKTATQRYEVLTEDDTLVTNGVLNATGREPNIDLLALDAIGLDSTANGILVNDHLQTNIPNIYAVGDVIDKPQPKLTPTATFEARYLAQLLGEHTTDPIDYPPIPTAVFSSPRLAQVGVSVTTAQAHPAEYRIVEQHLADNWYHQVSQSKIGTTILVFDQADCLVGATELSDRATASINTLLPAITLKLTAHEVNRIIPIFPTDESAAWKLLPHD